MRILLCLLGLRACGHLGHEHSVDAVWLRIDWGGRWTA